MIYIYTRDKVTVGNISTPQITNVSAEANIFIELLRNEKQYYMVILVEKISLKKYNSDFINNIIYDSKSQYIYNYTFVRLLVKNFDIPWPLYINFGVLGD